MSVNYLINQLLNYGLKNNLIEEHDVIYCANRLIDILHVKTFELVETDDIDINDLLVKICDYAYAEGIINSNDITTYDLFDTLLMDVIMPTMNGFEAANKIQSIINNNNFLNTKRISIVFVSACVNQQTDFEEIRKRLPIVKDFFTKPLKLNKIQEILDKYYYDNNLIIDS